MHLESRSLRRRSRILLHLSRPLQKAPEILALVPQELPKFQKADLLHLHAAVGFNPPQQIRTPPWRQPVTPRSIPHESDDVAHSTLIITRTDTKIHDGAEFGSFRVPSRPLWLRGFPMLESNLLVSENARQKAEAHYFAALDLFAEGERERSIEEYRKSADADPTFTEALHGWARALQDLERFDEAIEIAQRIAELDPGDVLAHTSLSVLYQKKGMIPEAEAEANKARVLGWKQQLKKS